MSLAPFTLTVTFLGLMSFVPIEKDGKLDSVWVLLPNAESGSPPCAGPNDHRHERHYAALRYPARFVAGQAVAAAGDEPHVVTYLRGFDARLRSGTEVRAASDPACHVEAGDLRRQGRALEVESPPRPNVDPRCDAAAFSWAAGMRRIGGDLAKVCSGCLGDAGESFPWDRVAARFRLDRGTLSTAVVSRKDNGDLQLYELPGDGSRQVLAEGVSLRLEGLTAPVQVELTDAKGVTRRISLQPTWPGEEVTLEVLNKPSFAILGAGVPDGVPYDDRDFDFYYLLSQGLDKCPPALPRPKKVDGEAGRPICPVTVMEP